MSILSDQQIKDLCVPVAYRNHFKPMITPFEENQVRQHSDGSKCISYGLSSYGYDLRCGFDFRIFSNINSSVVDPKDFDHNSFVDVKVEKPGDFILIPPNSFALSNSLEFMDIPRNVTGVVTGKSTLARCGIVCICTPLEAGWSGYVTLEFANTTPLPVKLYAGEGSCQVLFYEGDPCITSYDERNGKYMGQPAIPVLPKV